MTRDRERKVTSDLGKGVSTGEGQGTPERINILRRQLSRSFSVKNRMEVGLVRESSFKRYFKG